MGVRVGEVEGEAEVGEWDGVVVGCSGEGWLVGELEGRADGREVGSNVCSQAPVMVPS